MTSRTVSTLKFVGSISVGLLTGLSYSLSTLTVPTLLAFSNASSASRAFNNLTTLSVTHLQALAGISSTSFLLAYVFSPRSQKHPYLLWTSFFVAGSALTELILPRLTRKTIPVTRAVPKPKGEKVRGRQQMDASYEVLSHDSQSEGTQSDQEVEDAVNGEEVQAQIQAFMTNQIARTVVAGLGFAMSVVGIWGDGASAADVFIIEM